MSIGVRGGRGDQEAAEVQALLPRALHRHVALLSLRLSSMPDAGGRPTVPPPRGGAGGAGGEFERSFAWSYGFRLIFFFLFFSGNLVFSIL